MALLAGLLLCVAADQDPPAPPAPPVEKKQDAPPPGPEPKPQEPMPAEEDLPFLDLASLDLVPHVGLALFSDDFESDPQVCGGLGARAPLPRISRNLLGLDPGQLGLFLDLTVSRIDREIDPEPEDASGTVFFVSAGLDLEVLRADAFKVAVQGGLQYVHFGDVSDLDSGAGGLLGASASYGLAEGLGLFVNPQLSFGGDGDHVILIHVGLVCRF